MNEADDVVVGVPVHGEPRVRRARNDLRHAGQRRRGRDELDLGPRHQDLPDLPVRGLEHLPHDLPFIRAQRLVAHDQITKFLLGHHPASRFGVTAEDPHHEVGRPGQEPDQRAGQHRDPVQRRSREQRPPLRPLQREPLGRKLAEHQGEDRDRHGHHDQGDHRCHPGIDIVLDQGGFQVAGQGGRTDGAGKQRREGDAYLHRREETVGILGQPGGALPALALLRERLHLPFTQRDQGHLGPGKEPADEHDKQNDNDVPAHLVHVLIPTSQSTTGQSTTRGAWCAHSLSSHSGAKGN